MIQQMTRPEINEEAQLARLERQATRIAEMKARLEWKKQRFRAKTPLQKMERRGERYATALTRRPKYRGPTVIPLVVDGRRWLVTLSKAFHFASVHQSATDFLRRSATVSELVEKLEAVEKAQGVTLGLIEGSSDLYFPTLMKTGNVEWNQKAA